MLNTKREDIIENFEKLKMLARWPEKVLFPTFLSVKKLYENRVSHIESPFLLVFLKIFFLFPKQNLLLLRFIYFKLYMKN